MGKKVSIIGAGVSGLSAGCYLQMNGFETEIFEKQSTSGGLCTSWKRNGYTFDGCLHWLLGSDSGSPFFKKWNELIDIKSIPFHNHDVRLHIELLHNKNKYGENIFHLYTNINRLEKYMIDLAPEDSSTIKRLTGMMREIQKYDIPPMLDDTGVFSMFSNWIAMIKLLPFVYLYLKWKKVTNYIFAEQLTNPFLKEAFQLLFDGEDLNLLIIAMPLAYFDKNSAGYPIGGSYQFARQLEDKYKSIGGKIHFNSDVEKIIIENNIAKGIRLKNKIDIFSDITLSCADWYYTHFKALDEKFVNQTMLDLKDEKKMNVFYSIILISLGINRSFEDFPHLFRFPLQHEISSPDGTHYSRLEVHVYNYDPTLAPEGKTVVSISLNTTNSNYWIDLRNNDKETYVKTKNLFAEEIITILEEKIGNIKDFIEEKDVATPATYFRYTNNRKGSTQGWFPGKNIGAKSPVKMKIEGLKNFYYSSHWSTPGGGLPVAIMNARETAKKICKENGKHFFIGK